MTSVFCVFQVVKEGSNRNEFLVSIHATDTGAHKEAKKRNSKTKHYHHVEIWNVKP